MGSDTKANHKAKDEESNDTKGRNIGSGSSSSLGTVSGTPGLRRSARDTSLKKKLTLSPSSTRKRERLEKRPPTTPTVMRKSERLIEKTILSSSLRRSLRGAKKQSLSSSSGSKKSGESSGSSATKKEQKKEKSLKQLEMKEDGNSDKHATEALLVEAKRMDARAYRALFKRQPKKAKLEGRCEEIRKKNTNSNDRRDDGSENVDGNDDTVGLSSHKTLSELENNVAETEQKNLQAETPGLDTEVEGGYKVGLILGLMAFKQKRSFDNMNSDATTMVSNKDADAAPYECDRTDSLEKCATSSKRQRGNHQSNPQEHCSFNPNLNEDSCDSSVPKGRGRIEANDTAELAEQCITDLQHKKSSLDPRFNFDANTCLIGNSEVEGDEVVKKHNKVANNNTDSPSLKASLIGTSGAPMHNMSQSMPSSTGRLNTNDAYHISNFSHFNINLSEVLEANMVKYNERMNLDDSGKCLYLLLKPEIANLCEILQFPANVKVMVERFLDYVLNNHHISREPASTLQAFLLSLCWTAASMLKHKLGHKESLARAKQHLNFDCKKDEADFLYSKLRCLKKVFLYSIGASKVSASPKTGEFSNEVLSKNQSNGKSSLSTPSNTKKVRIEVENLRPSQEFSVDQVLSHLGLAQKDYTKSIKDIKKKCDKQMRKLLQKQQEERKELERKYEDEKADIEYMHRTEAVVIRLHSNVTVRTDELKLLDNQYAKEFQKLKQKMHICLATLLDSQLVSRSNLLERKAQWIEGVNSWVCAELINKSPLIESGCNQEIASKEQTPERAQSTPDGDVPPEVPETMSSNEDVLPGVMAISEPMSNGATSSMLGREFPLEVPQAASVREVLEDVVYVNSSSEEQIPDKQQILDEQVTSRVREANSSSDGSEREFPLDMTGILSSTDALENAASLNPSPKQHVEVDPLGVHETPCDVGGGITDPENGGGVCVAALAYNIGVDQHARVLFGGFETATGADVGCDHTQQEIDRTHVVASDNNQPIDQNVVQMPISMSEDPLQNELDRIRKETDQIIKIHEYSKLQLKSACEKAIQEAVADIRKKHDIKLQKMESEFLLKKKEMDENQDKVFKNKILAEAFMTKCMDNKASTSVRQQEMTSSIMQQLLQQSQSTTQRPSVVTIRNSTSLPTGATTNRIHRSIAPAIQT